MQDFTFDPDGDLILILSRVPTYNCERSIENSEESSIWASEHAKSETDGEYDKEIALNGEASTDTAPQTGGNGADHGGIHPDSDSASCEYVLDDSKTAKWQGITYCIHRSHDTGFLYLKL
jgi:hypothetical protein